MTGSQKCSWCGGDGPLKRGWTNAEYCSQSCEAEAVSLTHGLMPGGPNPYPGWLPDHIAREIKSRWASHNTREQGAD
jgi:hypothetical protein